MEKIALFGTGIIGERVVSILKRDGIRPISIFDNNPKKWNQSFDGIVISSPNDLNPDVYDAIVICTTDFYDEVYEQLIQIGCSSDKLRHWTYWLRKEFLEYYNTHRDMYSSSVLETIDYVRNNDRLEPFNYSFVEKYKGVVDTKFDDNCGLFYSYYKGKKLYLSEKYTNKKVADQYFESLLIEQDELSPHRYLDDDFSFSGGVLIDAGAAEGNFALENIDSADRVILIETDKTWNKALEKTFEPWKDRIRIVNKFLSDKVDEYNTTIDEVCGDSRIDFIKMDIEGAEVDALKGAERVLTRNSSIKMAICTYHNLDDELLIRRVLDKYSLSMSTTNGYMVFPYNIDQPMRLVKGVLRVEK